MQEKRPLVHFITNVVIVNDCANVTLAAGASPIMADAAEEVGQVTGICSALVLNMGTISRRTALSMLLAGRAAKAAGHPVVLDPVGAGISDLRNDTLRQILRDVRPDVIKGNISEMRYLAEGTGTAQGVDAAAGELTDESNLERHARMAQTIAARQNCVAIITGPMDIVADADHAYAVSNGSPWMGRISGTGCMTAAVLGAYAGANPGDRLNASLAAMVVMGLAGERASARLPEGGGSGTYHMLLLDGVSTLDGAALDAGRRVRRLF
ncbi:MAG: hydroxyethylthiazole kinase [Desulfovibrionaceae bacterium]|nr:hydroxyethylthiazole kinase [Desulfovibrionaceae bacterium]